MGAALIIAIEAFVGDVLARAEVVCHQNHVDVRQRVLEGEVHQLVKGGSRTGLEGVVGVRHK